MTGFDAWDVVVVPFPFVDATVQKPRPVVTLSAFEFSLQHGMIIGAMITRGAAGRWPTDVDILDFHSAGLMKPSVIRWKLFTLEARFIARRIGRLASEDRQAALQQLLEILALSDRANEPAATT